MILPTPTGDQTVAMAGKPPNPYTQYVSLASDTFTGRNVTPESALALPAVYGAVSLISNMIGTMPLETVVVTKGRPSVVKRGRLATLLRYAPNDDMPASIVWSLVSAHLCLRGNSYLAKLRDASGYVNELYPIDPDSVHPFRDYDGVKKFRVRLYSGNTFVDKVFGKSEILHVMGPSFNTGLLGASPIAVMRNALGIQLAREEYTARFYQQGAAIKGVISIPEKITPETAQLIRMQYQSRQAGMENSHTPLVIDAGGQFTTASINPQDQQLIEQMKWGPVEIATAFNLPAARLNADQQNMNYSNVGQDDLMMHKQAIRPRAVFIEEALNLDIDLFGATSSWVPMFNFDSALRVDPLTRVNIAVQRLRNRMSTPNTEIALEGGSLPLRDDEFGDVYADQLWAQGINTTGAANHGELGNPADETGGGNPAADDNTSDAAPPEPASKGGK